MTKPLSKVIMKRYKAQDGKCFYCEMFLVPFALQGELGLWRLIGVTKDHFVPKSVGGQKGHRNVVCSCWACNSSKASKIPTRKEQHRFKKIFGQNNFNEVWWRIKRFEKRAAT